MHTESLPPIRLRYNGLFNFDGLYAFVTDWAKNQGFMWHEQSYKHKVPSPKGAEQELTWLLTRNATDYVHYAIRIEVHMWDLIEVHVDHDGLQKSLSNARVEFLIIATAQTDWQKQFKGKFMETLGKFYFKSQQKEFEGVFVDQLYYRLWNLHAEMKKYLDVQSKNYAYKGIA